MYAYKNLGSEVLPKWVVVNQLNQVVAIVPSGFGSVAEGVANGIANALNSQSKWVLPILPDTSTEELVRNLQVVYHEQK